MSPVFPNTAVPVGGANAALPPPAWENHSARFSASPAFRLLPCALCDEMDAGGGREWDRAMPRGLSFGGGALSHVESLRRNRNFV